MKRFLPVSLLALSLVAGSQQFAAAFGGGYFNMQCGVGAVLQRHVRVPWVLQDNLLPTVLPAVRLPAVRSALRPIYVWLRARQWLSRLWPTRHGATRHGAARYGLSRHGAARYGLSRHGAARHGQPGMGYPGMGQPGMEQPGMVQTGYAPGQMGGWGAGPQGSAGPTGYPGMSFNVPAGQGVATASPQKGGVLDFGGYGGGGYGGPSNANSNAGGGYGGGGYGGGGTGTGGSATGTGGTGGYSNAQGGTSNALTGPSSASSQLNSQMNPTQRVLCSPRVAPLRVLRPRPHRGQRSERVALSSDRVLLHLLQLPQCRRPNSRTPSTRLRTCRASRSATLHRKGLATIRRPTRSITTTLFRATGQGVKAHAIAVAQASCLWRQV